MKLQVQPRTVDTKSKVKAARRNGQIPAIIYHKEKEGESILVNESEFQAALRAVKSGHLPTTIFKLTDEKGASRDAIIKDIQYHPTSYKVIHLDFEPLQKEVPVKVKVPIVITGEADSVGVKLGGVVRIVMRHIRVECLPSDIPENFVVDVKDMNMGQVVKVKDLKLPNTLRPLVRGEEVAVTMVKR